MTSLQRIHETTPEIREELRAVLRAAAAVDGASAFSDQAVLAAESGSRAFFAVRHLGSPGSFDAPAGFAMLGEGEVDLVIHPDFRGQALASAALRELLELAQQSSLHQVKAWSHGGHAAQEALLTRAGFAETRTLYKMNLAPETLVAAVDHARGLPDGAMLTTFDPHSEAHTDAWLRINSAAFVDHPEQGRVSRSDFTALTHEPWFVSDDLVFVSTASPVPSDFVGFAWVKTVTEPERAEVETELYVLAVHPAAAGTGFGAALFGIALQRMLAHSPTAVSLYVDASNTNAVALYQRAGFTVSAQSTQWERSLTVY